MIYHLNLKALLDLAAGKSVIISDGIHPTPMEVFLDREARQSLSEALGIDKSEENLVETTGAEGFKRSPVSERCDGSCMKDSSDMPCEACYRRVNPACEPFAGGGCYRATKLEKRLAEHYRTRHEDDKRFGALLDYLKKSATFIDFDLQTNGNPHRLELIEELRKRFLP